MRNGLHKIPITGIGFLLIGLTFSGCGRTEEVVTKQDATSISFSWWGNDPRHMYTMDGIDHFEELYPEIDVSYKYGVWSGYETRNRVYMKSHTEADVMQINYGWIDVYSPDGEGYYDIYTLSEDIDLANFSDSDLAFGEVDGKLNALPIAYNTPSIFYNKDIFDQYHLDLPDDWDDLFAAAEVMSEDNLYPLGMVKKHAFLLLLAYYEQTTGKHFFSANGNVLLKPDDIAYILEFYKRLMDEKVLLSMDKFERKQFTNGEVAGSMFWISDINNYCSDLEAKGANLVLGEYLGVRASSDLSGWYMKPATMYAISKNTDHPKEAAKLLDYLLNNPDMAMLQADEKGIPVSKSSYDTLVDHDIINENSFLANQKMLDMREKINIMIPEMEDEEIIEIFKAGMDVYVYDKASLEEASNMIFEGIKEYSAKK